MTRIPIKSTSFALTVAICWWVGTPGPWGQAGDTTARQIDESAAWLDDGLTAQEALRISVFLDALAGNPTLP